MIILSIEMGFREVFDPRTINGAYVVKRGLLESISGGSDYFVTEGRCNPVRLQDGQIAFKNEITFEDWRKDNISDNRSAFFRNNDCLDTGHINTGQRFR